MTTKYTLLSLDPQTTEEISKIAKEKCSGFATVSRMLIRERLNEIFPTPMPSKVEEQGTTQHPEAQVMRNV